MSNIDKYVKIEKYLNKFRFHGVRLGGTLADQYILHRGGTLHVNTGKSLLFAIREVCTLFISIARFGTKQKGEYLFTRISNKSHINSLIVPLLDYYQGQYLLISNPAIFGKGKMPENSISIRDTFKVAFGDIFSICSTWAKCICALMRNMTRMGIDGRSTLHFAIMLLHQLRVISFWNGYFKANRSVKAVVVEFDRNNVAAPLILTANNFNIPTITLVHGVINDYGYVPLLARDILCWGKIQKDQLMEFKVPEQRIHIVGNPIINFKGNDKRSVVRNSNGITLGFGLNPISLQLNQHFFGLMLEAIKRTVNVSLTIKLHPSQKKADFEWLLSQVQGMPITMYESSELSNQQFFNSIDFLMINNSALGNEALMFGLPVGVIWKEGVPLSGNSLTLVDLAGCPLFLRADDIVDTVDRIRNSGEFIQHLHDRAANFLKNMYYATGAEASANITDKINMLKRQH